MNAVSLMELQGMGNSVKIVAKDLSWKQALDILLQESKLCSFLDHFFTLVILLQESKLCSCIDSLLHLYIGGSNFLKCVVNMSIGKSGRIITL